MVVVLAELGIRVILSGSGGRLFSSAPAGRLGRRSRGRRRTTKPCSCGLPGFFLTASAGCLLSRGEPFTPDLLRVDQRVMRRFRGESCRLLLRCQQRVLTLGFHPLALGTFGRESVTLLG